MAEQYGLHQREADALLVQYGENVLPQQKPKNSLNLILNVVKEPMIALLIIGGGLYLWLGDKTEAIMLFIMIFGVSGITFIQEHRTEKALQSLKEIASPRCRVLRDGKEILLNSALLVPGDVIKIVEGERIPADGKVLESINASVDESVLTGESLPVSKTANDISNTDQLTSSNQIYSSTLLKTGWIIARVEKTGAETQIGKIGSSLENIHEQKTRIQKETKQIVTVSAIAGLLVSLIVVIGMGLRSGNLIESVLQGIAIAMSMLPEEFPVVLTIFMALGAAKIAKKQVLMRHLPALETLGSATVLCVDKTGTLTQNKMDIAALVDKKNSVTKKEDWNFSHREIIETAAHACQQHHDDPMEKAIIEAVDKKNQEKPIHHYPITQSCLVMANAYKASHGRYFIAAKGAPESILKLCTHELESEKQNIQAEVHELARKGMRILAVAESGHLSKWRDNQQLTDFPFHFVGLIAFADPIRSDVPNAICACKNAGIRPVMITGDYVETAKTIGEQLDLIGADLAITGDDIKTLPANKLRHLLSSTSVCARIMPEQKLAIVKALQADGEIVAMTGDGINDAPALKAADMGIAMGKRGTDVAREAADMVLMDDSFSSIINAIREGRLIFDNIRKAIGFVMAIHIPIALMAIAPVIFGLSPLLTPVHVVILELIIDPACTLVFESEKADSNIMKRPPKNPVDRIFDKVMYIKSVCFGGIVSLTILASFYLASVSVSDQDILRTVAFTTLICMNCILIASFRSDMPLYNTLRNPNKAFWGVIFGVTLFLVSVMYIPFLQHVMELSLLNSHEIMIVILCSSVGLLCIDMTKRIIRTS